jgi:hypothetical protein
MHDHGEQKEEPYMTFVAEEVVVVVAVTVIVSVPGGYF